MPIDVQTRATEGPGATNLDRILTTEELDTNFITLKQSSNILYENVNLSANNVKDALDEVKQEIDDLDFTASNIEYEFAPTFTFDNVETALNTLFNDREIQNVTAEDDPTNLFYPTMEDKKEGQSDLVSVVDDFYYVPAQKRLYVNTLNGNVIGNTSTATTLQTSRQINGTSFDGSSNIITSNWGTARNITIGATTKSVNGSSNVSWNLQEIGVTAENTAFNNQPSNVPQTNVQAVIDSIIATLVPSGFIGMWSGSIANVPQGWALCDGNNGTPNLTDRFVVGAGSNYSVGSIGGSKDAVVVSHTHGASTASAGSHNHSASTENAGSHNHSASTGNAGSHNHSASTGGAGAHSHTASTGNAGVHTHSASTGGAGAHSHTITNFATGPIPDSWGHGNYDIRFSSNQNTSSVGNHSHSVSINSAGSHNHSVNVNAVSNHNHTVSVNNAGVHNHPVTVDPVGNHNHTVSVNNAGVHSHSVTVNSAGESGVNKNLPPYYALAYIMKL